MFKVLVTDSNGARSEFEVGKEAASIGRADDNVIVLKGWTVGKRQATIEARPTGLYVVDHGGLSVTEVNGKTIEGEHGPLVADDQIGIAGYRLQVVAPAASRPAPSIAVVPPPRNEPEAAGAAAPAVVTPPAAASAPARPVAAPISAPSAPAAAAPEPQPAPLSPPPAPAAQPMLTTPQRDALNKARIIVQQKLISTMDLRRVDVTRMNEEELRNTTATLIGEIIATEPTLGAVDRARLAKEVLDEAVGLGPLEELLSDPSVTEIMVNRFDQIYIERSGKLTLSDISFTAEKNVVSAIERIVAPLGRRIDESSPMVDARLKDGSRVNAVIPPLALKGANITIRKFSKTKLKDVDLIKYGSVTKEIMDFMQQAVHHHANIVISGGTGSGKTTLLNVLSNYIPEGDRIVTVEDAAELQLNQPHVVSLESRPPNVEGKGAVTIRDLVKNCLRMRPDRIVVGECRGGEALDMLQAMNTGHDGSLTTTHANTPRDCIARLEVLTLMSGIELPIRAIREQISSAVHIIIQQSRFPDGSRRVTHVTEITGMEGDMIQLQDIFLFKMEGYGPDGKIRGKFIATGAIPDFYASLSERGIPVDLSIFQKDRVL
jgi:pilus assembly protein CpaF